MTPRSARVRARLGVLSMAGAIALLAGCAGEDPGRPVAVGTTVTLESLDPVVTADRDTLSVLSLLYPRLMSREFNDDGTVSFVPELAETAEFTGDTEFTVTLPPGLEFSNGDELNASDVVFSFDRQFALRGEASTFPLLDGIVSVKAVDARTVVFELATADDATFPAVLAGPAGAILDEEVFSADAATPAEVVLAAGSYAGRFVIAPPENEPSTRDLLLEANADFRGPDPVDADLALAFEFDREPAELAERLTSGGLEVVFGDLPLEEYRALVEASGVRSVEQPSTTLRLLFFDFETMPFGSETEQADGDAAAAVRAAVADLIDREALGEVAPSLWDPAFGYLPTALATPPGVFESGRYGNEAAVDPDPERAAERLATAGVETPVELTIAASTAESDPAGAELREALVAQLEEGGIFRVTIREVDEPLSRDLLALEEFPLFEYRWDPLGAGIDDYFSPLFSSTDGLPTGGGTSTTDELIAEERTSLDGAVRAAAVAELEERLAARLPAIPLLSSKEIIFSSMSISLGDTTTAGLDWLVDLMRR